MKIFVTDVAGQLGHDVMNELVRRGHEAIGSDIWENSNNGLELPYISMDITDENSVDNILKTVKPDAVIHCAAWTAVDAAEEENKKQIYIPEGFAHGFLVLSDVAEICYKCTDFYHPDDEGGLAWNDPGIGIIWPQVIGEYHGTASSDGYRLTDGTLLKLSEKDQLWNRLEDNNG